MHSESAKYTAAVSVFNPKPPGFSLECDLWLLRKRAEFEIKSVFGTSWLVLRYAPHLQFVRRCSRGILTGPAAAWWCSGWHSRLCVEFARSPSACVGFPQPVQFLPTDQNHALGWSEAVIVPVGVSECCVSCGGLVTCPEWIPASCQVTAWRHSSTSYDLDQEYRSLPDLLRAEATLGALDI